MSSGQLKSGLSERILAVLDWSGMSQTKLSRFLGVPQATLNRHIRESDNDLFQHVPGLLRLFPELNPGWLWNTEAEPIKAVATVIVKTAPATVIEFGPTTLNSYPPAQRCVVDVKKTAPARGAMKSSGGGKECQTGAAVMGDDSAV